MMTHMTVVAVLFFVIVAELSAQNITPHPVIAPLPDQVVIQHWQDSVTKTKTIHAEFKVVIHDTTFKTTRMGKGKLFIKGKKQCRLETIPLNKDEHRIAQKDHPKYRQLMPHINRWTQNNQLLMVYLKDKYYVKCDLGKDHPYFGLQQIDFYKRLTPYINKKNRTTIKVETTPKFYYLTFHTLSKSNASDWSGFKAAIEIRTEKLIAIQMTSPSGDLAVKWLFDILEINQHIKDDQGLFDVSLKGLSSLDQLQGVKPKKPVPVIPK